MRAVMKFLVVLGAIVAVAWIGGEALLARQAAALIAAESRIDAAAVHELREPRRMGLRMKQLELQAPEGVVMLPWLEVWVRPQSPMEVNATLPPRAEILLDGHALTLTTTGATASVRFSPAHAFTMSAAQARADRIALNGEPLAQGLNVVLRLAGFGSDAPPAAGAAYDFGVEIAEWTPRGLTGGAVGDTAGLSGEGRIWLDHAPARGGSTVPPRLVGFRADGLAVQWGDLRVSIRGRIVADATGHAEGELLIDTPDAAGFIARASEMGLLPAAAVPVASALLQGLANVAAATPLPPDDATAGNAEQAGPSADHSTGLAVPPPPPGELRIPLSFREGKIWLGPVPLGAAPNFSA